MRATERARYLRAIEAYVQSLGHDYATLRLECGLVDARSTAEWYWFIELVDANGDTIASMSGPERTPDTALAEFVVQVVQRDPDEP